MCINYVPHIAITKLLHSVTYKLQPISSCVIHVFRHDAWGHDVPNVECFVVISRFKLWINWWQLFILVEFKCVSTYILICSSGQDNENGSLGLWVVEYIYYTPEFMLCTSVSHPWSCHALIIKICSWFNYNIITNKLHSLQWRLQFNYTKMVCIMALISMRHTHTQMCTGRYSITSTSNAIHNCKSRDSPIRFPWIL